MADTSPEDLNVSIVANIARFERSLAGIEAAARRVLGRMEKNVQANLGVKLDIKSAEASAQVLERELDRLRSKYDPLFAASKQYEAQIAELAQAHRLGALNAEQYGKALQKINSDYASSAAPKIDTGPSEEYLERLKAKYDPLHAAAQKVKQSLEEIKTLQDAGAMTSEQYAAALQKITDEWDRVKNAGSVKMANELESLKLKFDPIYAATKQYEAGVEELNRAQEQGVVDANAYAAALDKLNRELNKKIGGVNADEAAKELERLRLEFDPLYAASRRYEEQFNRLTEAHDRGVLDANRYQQALQKLNTQFAQNSGPIKTFATDQLEEMRAKFDPLFAASKRYEKQVEELDQAMKLGVLSPTAYNNALEQLNTQFQRNYGSNYANDIEKLRLEFDHAYAATVEFEAGVERLNAALRQGIVNPQQYATELKKLEDNRLAYVMEESQKASRRLGMGIQNASYQIADFAVQVGSGTDAARALGQQIPQLIGGFGVWGAALGAAAAIFIPLITYLVQAKDGIEDLDKAFEGAQTATNAWQSANDAAVVSLTELTAKYGELADMILQVNERSEQFARQNALIANQGVAKSFLKEIGGVDIEKRVNPDGFIAGTASIIARGMGADAVDVTITEYERAIARLQKKLKLGEKSFNEFYASMISLSATEDAEAQLGAVSRAIELIEAGVSKTDLAAMAAEQDSFYSQMLRMQKELADLTITIEQRKTAELRAEYDAQHEAARQNAENLEFAYRQLDKARNDGDTAGEARWNRMISNLKKERGEITLNEEKVQDMIKTLRQYDAGLGMLGYDEDNEIREGIAETIERLITAAGETENLDLVTLENLRDQFDGLTERLARFLGKIGETKDSLKELNSAAAFEEDYVRRAASGAGSQDEELVRAVSALAEQLGVAAKDLLTVMSFETGGKLRPDTPGPITPQWGRHFGLIQWGERGAAQRYGVSPNDSITEQVIAAGKYLQDAGVKAGDGLMKIYAAVNTGHVSTGHRSDSKVGGTWGSANEKVLYQMDDHKARAEGLLAAHAGAAKEAAELARNQLEWNEGIRASTREMELQRSLIGKSAYDTAYMTKQAELLADAERRRLPMTEELRRSINSQAEAAAHLAYTQERAREDEQLIQRQKQAQEGFADAIEQSAQNIALQNELLGKSAYQTAYLTTQSQLRGQAVREGIILTESQSAAIEEQAQAAGRLAEAQERQRLADAQARKDESERQRQAEKAIQLRERLAQQVEDDISRSQLNTQIAGMSDADQARLIKQFEMLQDMKKARVDLNAVRDPTSGSGQTWAEYAAEASMAAGAAAEAEERAKQSAAAARKAAADRIAADERALEVRKNLAQQVEDDITQAEFEISIMGMSESMQARLTKQFEILQNLRRQNVDLDSEMFDTGKTWAQWAAEVAEATGVAIDAQDRYTKSIENTKEKTDFLNDVNKTMKDGFIEAIAAGEGLASVLDQVAEMLMKAALQAALFNEGPFSVSGAGGGLMGSVFDGVMGWLGLGGSTPTGNNAPTGFGAQPTLTPPSALMTNPSQMVSNQMPTNININLSGANGDRTIANIARQSVVQGLSEYDRSLPGRVRSINSRPRDL
jgi:hypothetical protein